MLNKKFSFIIFISVLLSCCKPVLVEKGSADYIKAIKDWHSTRVERLKQENGWLNLVGLFWLKEGENTFGGSKDNYITFPAEISPPFIGSFFLHDTSVTVRVNKGIGVLYNGNPVKTLDLKTDIEDSTTVLALNSLRWFVIKRGRKFGIRLRNINSPLIKSFKGIDTFPVNEDWKIAARFEEYKPHKRILIPTIIGTVEEDYSPGKLVFEINGTQYSVDPVSEDGNLFIIFADETSGEETYGAGRFLYTSAPDSTGNVVLDFNKSYNPPCAFTKYATCPLPPKQNYLSIRITAGEKKYNH